MSIDRAGGCHSHSHCEGGGRRERRDDFRENILNNQLDSLNGRIERLKDYYECHKDELSSRERHEFREDIRQLEERACRLDEKINEGYLSRDEFREINHQLDRFEDRIGRERRELREDVRDGDCGDNDRPGCHWVPPQTSCCGEFVPGHWASDGPTQHRQRREGGGGGGGSDVGDFLFTATIGHPLSPIGGVIIGAEVAGNIVEDVWDNTLGKIF
jgi:hypothetical protein